MPTSFHDLAQSFLKLIGMPDSPRGPDPHYLLEIQTQDHDTHTMLLQEGNSEGTLEVYTTVANGNLHPELLEIGSQQNLATFRSRGNTFAIDRDSECALLCGRYEPFQADNESFDDWSQAYLAEMNLYHTIADKLSQDLLDDLEAVRPDVESTDGFSEEEILRG